MATIFVVATFLVVPPAGVPVAPSPRHRVKPPSAAGTSVLGPVKGEVIVLQQEIRRRLRPVRAGPGIENPPPHPDECFRDGVSPLSRLTADDRLRGRR